MKALKTIVATAVIVFALTTVAAAGVQRLGGADQTAGPAAAAPAATAPQTQTQATVTLTTRQFARLMRAAGGGTTRHQAALHDRDRDGEHVRDRSHTGDAGVRSSDTAVHSTTPAVAHSYDYDHTASQSGSGSHDSGEHHSGEQDGGCE